MRSLPVTIGVLIAAVAIGCGGQGSAGDGGGPDDGGGAGGADTGGPTGSGGSTPTGGGGATTGGGGATTGSGGAGGAGGGGSATGMWVSGYYVGYQQHLNPPETIAWNGLTHLMIGRVVPSWDGSLNTNFDIDPVGGPAYGKKLAKLARDNGKKAILMLGGAGTHDQFASAASAANRAAFVQNLVSIAGEYGFDGFDLDWEPLPPSDYPNLKALAQDLRAAMPEVILTIPVGWVSSNFPSVDPFYAEVAPLFDQINIMSYGMLGPWDGWLSWHSGALMGEKPNTPTSIDISVKTYLAAGVPAAKLGMGIAFYGECWVAPVTGPNQQLGGAYITASDNVMSYAHIMSAYYSDSASGWDPVARASYLSFNAPHGPEGCTYITYEDETSIQEKGDYAKTMGLGGTIVWTINQGHMPGATQTDPLMKALEESFLQ